jgi:hypothetical protein
MTCGGGENDAFVVFTTHCKSFKKMAIVVSKICNKVTKAEGWDANFVVHSG